VKVRISYRTTELYLKLTIWLTWLNYLTNSKFQYNPRKSKVL